MCRKLDPSVREVMEPISIITTVSSSIVRRINVFEAFLSSNLKLFEEFEA